MTTIQQAIEYFEKYGLIASASILRDRFIEIEKIQVMDAYKRGCKDTYGNDEPSPHDKDDFIIAEQYYNDTFKNKT
jgi:hypothetical protein